VSRYPEPDAERQDEVHDDDAEIVSDLDGDAGGDFGDGGDSA
jgi:hypothetical protein